MGVAAARVSAESMPPSMGMAKTETKTVSAAGETDPRPVQPSAVPTEANTSDESTRGSRMAVNSYTWLVCVKIVKYGRAKKNTQDSMVNPGHDPTQDSDFARGTSPLKEVLSVRGASLPKEVLSVRGTSPTKPTPGISDERARSPPARRR